MKKCLLLMVVLVLSLWTMGQVLQTQSFDDPTFPPAGWVVTNAGTGNDWTQSTYSPYAGAGTMFYNYHTNAADTWAFTPGITLTGGITYYVDFYQKVESATYPERLKVTVGQGQTVAAQTTVIWDNAGGSNLTNETYIKRTASFTPGATGTYNFAFNCYSEAYHYYLYVDEYRLYVPAPVYPMTGIWTIDPAGSGSNNFTTLAAAINYLNYNGVGSGGVTFNIVANYTETFSSSTAGLITATGTSSNPILFKKNGEGSNPLITAGVGTSTTTDGIIVIAGGDYITFENIDLQENNLNTDATTQMEWGYALVKANATAPFNGCQNNTIRNCTITLNKANPASVGIYSGNHTASNTTLLTITDVSDAMNNCKFYGNMISNVYRGITLIGFNAPSPYTLYDSNNEIGVEGANIITNFGGAAGGTNIVPQAYGIYTWYSSNIKVANNTINGGAGTIPYLYGIRTSSGSNGDVYNNTITLNGGANNAVYGIGSELGATGTTVNIHHNKIENCSLTTATTSLFYGIQNQIVTTIAFNVNIYENEIRNNLLSGTGNIIGIDGGYGGIIDIYNNSIHNNTKDNSGQITMIKTGTSGTKYQIHENIMFANNIITVGTVSASSTINGFYCLGSPSEFFYNNQIYECYVGGTTTGSSTVYGINGYSLNSLSKSFNGNTIRNLAINSGSGTVYGIYFGNVNAGTSYTLNNNKVYGLFAAGTSGAVTGIHIAGGNGLHIYNNFISDLKTPDAMGAIAIKGMNIAGGSSVNAYFNTIYLNASSTATTFGSSGIYKSATVNSDFRNNCVVNVSIPGSSGKTAAFMWSNTYNSSYYSSLSNNNNWYAGTPSSSNLIFYDGTNSDQTLTDFQARVFPKESNSVTENPPFINVATAPYDLHLSTTVPTFCEGSGTPVSTPILITDDIDTDLRGIIPDIGADEFAGIPNYTCSVSSPGNTLTTGNPICIGQSITLSLQTNPTGTGNLFQWQSSTDNVTYSDIPGASMLIYTLTPSSIAFYRCKVTCMSGPSTAYSNPIQITFSTSLTSIIPGSNCGPGTVNLSATSSSTINWYGTQTGPSYLATGSSWTTPPISTTTSYYVAAEDVSQGSVTVGAGATTSASYPNPFYSAKSNIHTQHLITASELSAAGLTTGNIVSVALNVTNAGTLPMKDLSLKIAATNANDVSSFLSPAFTTVYTNPSFMPVTGINTLTFSVPFYWDGISNIVLEFCHGNSASAASMSRTVRSDATTFVSSIKTHSNTQVSGSTICGDVTSNLLTYSSRPQFTFVGQKITCSSPRNEVIATISNSVPSQPSTIAGPTNPLEGSSQTYSVINDPGVSYAWTFPSGWVQTGGGNTNEVTVTVGNGSGDITVTPSTVCGNGTERTLAVAPVPSGFAITFNVDMSTAEGFIPGTDVVYLTGNFPGATWVTPGDAGSMAMIQVGTTLIYTHTLTLAAGTYEYKYFKNAGWDGGEYAGGNNRSVAISSTSIQNDTWGGSINWANLQWPGTGSIETGGAFDVYAQAYIPNGITYPAGVTYGLQAWIGYSTDNTDPDTWTNWIPAPFFGQSFDNDEFKVNLGNVLTSEGTYYYASRFQFGNSSFVYGGFSGTNGGFWDGTTNVSGVLTVTAPVTKVLNLKVYLEGLYNEATGEMNQAQGISGAQFGTGIADKVTLELHNANSPFGMVSTFADVDLLVDGVISINSVPANLAGSYYIVVKHRNSIETWSSNPVSFAVASPISYDFTTDASQAFGNNLKQVGTAYVVWGGETTQDGIVDGSDMAAIDNASTATLTGYYPEDVNGDGIVDGSDMAVIDNNSTATVQVQKP